MATSIEGYNTTPELKLVWDNAEQVHRAQDITDHHNPFDIELPEIDTIKIHGNVTLPKGEETDYTLEFAEESDLDSVFLLFSGFGGIKMSSSPFSNAMARLHMPLIHFEPIRRDNRLNKERLLNPHKIHIETMEEVLGDIEDNIGIKFGKGVDESRIGVIGHSMGGEPAIRFAEEHPEVTEEVILIATIGFGSPNILEIAKKLPGGIVPSVKEELVPFFKSDEIDLSLSGAIKAIRYFTDNLPRTTGEVGSCLTSDQEDRVHNLRANGIPTIYGQPVYDLLVQGAEGASRSVDMVGTIKRAGHMVLQAKSGRAAWWVKSALTASQIANPAA